MASPSAVLDLVNEENEDGLESEVIPLSEVQGMTRQRMTSSDAGATPPENRAAGRQFLVQKRRLSQPDPENLPGYRAPRSSTQIAGSFTRGRCSSCTSGASGRSRRTTDERRSTMDELRSQSRDTEEEGPVLAPRFDPAQIAELVRWDPAVKSLLDELKSGQEQLMDKSEKLAFGVASVVSNPRLSTNMLRNSSSRYAAGSGDGSLGAFGDITTMSNLTRARRTVIDPAGCTRKTLDILILAFVAYTLIAVPVYTLFLRDYPMSVLVLNALCDVTFLLDIAVTFRTAVPDRLLGVLVTSPKRIAQIYSRSWFVVDVIATLPLDNIVGVSNARPLLGLLRVLKALRLIRMFLGQDSYHVEPDAFVHPSVKTLLKLLLALLLFWHWIACIYYELSRQSTTSESLFAPWLSAGESEFAPPPSLRSGGTATAFSRYCYALYWAVGLTCQIGILPCRPDTQAQQVFAVLVSMSGVLTLSMIIGSATTVIADLSAQAAEVSKRLQRIARYMRYKQLPPALRQRILSFYAFQNQSAQLDESSVLVDLPSSLKMQMDVVVHQLIFLHLPLFRMCKNEEILMIVQCLKPALTLPGETLVRQGERGLGLFFLMKGHVEILSGEEHLTTLSAISAFGETSLLPDLVPNATVRASGFCEVTLLTTQDFSAIAVHCPSLLLNLQLYVAKRDARAAESQPSPMGARMSGRWSEKSTSGRCSDKSKAKAEGESPKRKVGFAMGGTSKSATVTPAEQSGFRSSASEDEDEDSRG